jgi:hypothetical protein
MSFKPISRVAALLVIGVTAAVVLALVQPPAWIMLLLGMMALAVLYIVARPRSRFDPLDPRFGGCIPPMTKPRDGEAA